MLQTVLHCLAQQQRVLEKNVEVHGMANPMGRESANAQTIAIQEFAIGTDGQPPVQKPRQGAPEDTILVVERIKKTDAPSAQIGPASLPAVGVASRAAVEGQDGAAGMEGRDGAAGAQGTPGVSAPEGLSLVTYSKFNLLQNTVQDLQKRVYGSIPKNEDILEEVRSQTNIKAIQDMWQNLNVSARLEAAENGIGKLSSIVQDIINETSGLKDIAHSALSFLQKAQDAKADKSSGAASGVPSHASTGVSSAGNAPAVSSHGAAGAISSPVESGYPLGPSASKAELDGVEEYVKRLREDLDTLTNVFYKAMQQMPNPIDLPPPPGAGPRLEEILAPKASGYGGGASGADGGEKSGIGSDGAGSGTDRPGGGGRGGRARRSRSTRLGGGGVRAISSSESIHSDVLDLMERMNDVERRLEDCEKTLAKGEGGIQDQILLEQIELLKAIKLDREDMAEAMAEKADLRMLAKKVSHNQFELACDDLSRGLEHALGKLNMQEALWQQALDDIQREIETKLDKMELSPVKEFFNNKLRMLQESLKQMASLRREAEAAGTKRRLLRDVNCLSCDANAVMQMDAPPAIPVPKPFPGTLSMKPYLSYELDVIRKTQASNLPQRNMHDWENIDKQMSQSQKPQKVRSGADKHLCNRYCGGSHTTTTPSQRVARLGHFIKQWGPDVLPLSSGLAAGDDGRMYRVIEGTNGSKPGGTVETTCTPKPLKKPELPSVSSDRNIAEDCKCLEPTPPTGKEK